MKKIAILVFAGLILAVSTSSFAQQYPNVKNLKPFSAEANFMSLPGYLRWVVFQQTNNWLSMAEAQRIVKSQ
jgi:hypothetical protein